MNGDADSLAIAFLLLAQPLALSAFCLAPRCPTFLTLGDEVPLLSHRAQNALSSYSLAEPLQQALL